MKNFYTAPDGKRYQTKAFSFSKATAAAPVQLLEAAADRVAIILTTTGTGAVQVGIDQTVSTTNGINLSLTAGPFDMTTHDFGDLVTGAWWAVSNPASNVSGFEVRLVGPPIEE